MNLIPIMFTAGLAMAFGLNTQVQKYSINLDQDKRYKFEWSVDHSMQRIQVKLTAKVTPSSWFAFGFSDYGELTDADLVAFWTDSTMEHHFVDGHTTSSGRLEPDFSQDYHLTSVSSRNLEVILEFWRHLDTCDSQDYALDNGTTHLIYVEDNTQGTSPFGLDIHHLRHNVQRTQVIKPKLKKPVFPDDTWVFEVRAPEVIVPAKETTYWWHTTVLPNIPRRHHIIQYEGIVSEDSQGIVHHMEVFHCQVKPGDRIPYYSGPGLSEGKPKGLGACRNVIGAWAMGAQAMVYPENAGVPIGGANFSRFALLEIHFNNPEKKAGHMDTSGIRFYVTSQLRQYDAGIMELGLEYTNKMAIPPGQENFKLSGYCVGRCTDMGLPSAGIHVFASQLHTHQTGKRVYTRHIRQGVELPELNRDNHYSPHFQEIRALQYNVHVLPGDHLITTCEFNTVSRPNATVGGFSISDEMCVNYVHYYPRTNLEVCKSSIQSRALDYFFRFIDSVEQVHLPEDIGTRAMYQLTPWPPTNVQLLEFLYATSPLSMQCNQSNGQRFPGYWDRTVIPIVQVPLQQENDYSGHCMKKNSIRS